MGKYSIDFYKRSDMVRICQWVLSDGGWVVIKEATRSET